jgi:hypothetical protein
VVRSDDEGEVVVMMTRLDNEVAVSNYNSEADGWL